MHNRPNNIGSEIKLELTCIGSSDSSRGTGKDLGWKGELNVNKSLKSG